MSKDVAEYNNAKKNSFWTIIGINLLIAIITAFIMNAFVIAYSRKELAWLQIHCSNRYYAFKKTFTITSPFYNFFLFKLIWILLYLIFYFGHWKLIVPYFYSLPFELALYMIISYFINTRLISEFIKPDNKLYSILKGQ